jgi:hypothetical protein
MGVNEDLTDVVSLDEERLSAWLDGHEQVGVSTQWWWGMLESIETQTGGFRGLSVARRHELVAVAARLLAIGEDRGWLSSVLRSYWQLRLAVDVTRGDPSSAR